MVCYNEIMAVIEPNSEIYLIKSPIELDNDNQLNFASKTAQANYFLSLPHVRMEKATFQRKDGTIRWNASFEDVMQYNYCMYRNINYGNKWFYAFITNVEWLSNDSSAITIKTDVWQTWQFDITFKRCFVEREHVNNDTFGIHTIPEGLEYGEYIVNSVVDTDYSIALSDCYLVVQASDLCNAMYNYFSDNPPTRIYNGIPQGCYFICLTTESYTDLNNFLLSYDAENKADAIVSIGLIPKALVDGEPVVISFATSYGFDAFMLPPSTTTKTLTTTTLAKQTTLNGYTPKNNKCLCSPYNYLLATNNGGTTVEYAWEEFSGSTANFTTRGVITQGCDIKTTPSNYKNTNLSGGYEWSLTSQKLPMISWNSNFYLNWCAVNGKYLEQQKGFTLGNFALGIAGGIANRNTMEIAKSMGGLASSIASIEQQQREASMTPPSARGNANSGDINFTLGKSKCSFYKMSIKAEYAKIIDDYFTQFGYKVNSLKIPNLTGRPNWNYVKTHGCNILGDVPQADLQEIKDLFNRGITIWHNTTTFLDYSQNNQLS